MRYWFWFCRLIEQPEPPRATLYDRHVLTMPSATESSRPSLSSSVLTGASWIALSRIAAQALSLVSVTVVARALSPEAYGLVGMAQLVIGFVSLFQDLGTSSAVVQRREVDQRFLSTIWWLNLALSTLLAGICWVLSPLAADFYHEPAVQKVLRILGLGFILAAGSTVQAALLSRSLQFRSLAIRDIISSATGLVVAIIMAYSGAGVWALVGASLSTTAVSTVLVMILARWAPSFSFSWPDIRSIARFGANLSAFNLINYFARNADNALVGRYLGAGPLGYYQLAYRMMLYPVENISQTLGRALFPAFTKMQDDYGRFRVAYLRACAAIAFLTFPLMIGALILADELVRVLLGPKWVPTIPVFQILALVGMVQSISTTVGQIYIATGRTDLMLRWGTLFVSLIVVGFAVGLPWGIQGVAIAYAIVIAAIVIPVFWAAFRIIDLPLLDLWRALWPGLKCTLIMAVVVLTLHQALARTAPHWPIIRLAACSLVGAVVYLYLMFRMRSPVLGDVIQLTRRTISEWRTSKVVLPETCSE
jgi:O-antigen/teichoic acid export membrane protein